MSAWDLLFGLDGRLIFSEREAGVGVYFGSLPRAVALSIGTPAGSVDKHAELFFFCSYTVLCSLTMWVKGKA